MGNIDKVDAVFAGMNTPQHPGAGLLVIDHNEIGRDRLQKVLWPRRP